MVGVFFCGGSATGMILGCGCQRHRQRFWLRRVDRGFFNERGGSATGMIFNERATFEEMGYALGEGDPLTAYRASRGMTVNTAGFPQGAGNPRSDGAA